MEYHEEEDDGKEEMKEIFLMNRRLSRIRIRTKIRKAIMESTCYDHAKVTLPSKMSEMSEMSGTYRTCTPYHTAYGPQGLSAG